MAKSTLTPERIIDFIRSHPSCSSKDIHLGLEQEWGYATVKRVLQVLITEQLIIAQGRGKGTKYIMSQSYELLMPIDPENYFLKEIDEREIRADYNHALISEQLQNCSLFTESEQELLNGLQEIFKKTRKN